MGKYGRVFLARDSSHRENRLRAKKGCSKVERLRLKNAPVIKARKQWKW